MNVFSLSPRPHFILMIGDEGVLLAPCPAANITKPYFMPASDEKSIRAILAIIAQNPRALVTLFADTLAQDFRRDELPRLNPFDRRKLIQRRLQQAFPQAQLRASLNLKNNRAQILFAGLHGDGPVFDWLKRLAAITAPRVCLAPIECAGMVTKLLPESADGWGLILSRQRTGGFRQIVTHKGELIFTRLTPPLPPAAGVDEIIETIRRDIQASRGYLGRLGLREDTPLATVLLVPESFQEVWQRRPYPFSARLLTPHAAALQLELSFVPAPNDPFSDLLFAGWLAQKKRPQLSLMLPDMRQTQQTTVIKRWGTRAATAMLITALATASWQASDLVTAIKHNRTEITQLALARQKLVRQQAAGEPATEPLGRLRAALERQRLFEAATPMPWIALQGVARGIDDAAQLTKLEWNNDSGKLADETMQIHIRLAAGQSPMLAKQAVVARFQQIAQNLTQTLPDYTINVTRYPFPALPQEALSNKTAMESETPPDATAEFAIKRKAL